MIVLLSRDKAGGGAPSPLPPANTHNDEPMGDLDTVDKARLLELSRLLCASSPHPSELDSVTIIVGVLLRRLRRSPGASTRAIVTELRALSDTTPQERFPARALEIIAGEHGQSDAAQTADERKQRPQRGHGA